MSNREQIKKFIKERGVSQKKICDTIDISAKTLYLIINVDRPKGIADWQIRKFNNMFEDYNYDGRLK
jgi:transposase